MPDFPTTDPRGLQLIDPVLTNLALNYRSEGFVYDQVVAKMSGLANAGQYPEWSRADFLRDDVDPEVDHRSETPEIDADYALRDFLLKNYRLKVSISTEERSQAGQGHGPAIRLERSKLNLLLDRLTIRRERRLAAALRKTTNGGQLTLGAGVSTKWDASSGTTIEQDLKAARKGVYDATGKHVDTAIFTWDVAYAVALDPVVREIIKYTVPGDMIISRGEKILPRQLHGLNIVIADGTKFNAAQKGADENLQDIWGDHVRLVKRGVDEQWGEPATVYALRGQVLGTQEGRARRDPSLGGGFLLVDRWAEADPPVDYIRAWEKVEEKVVAADIAFEIEDVLT